MDGADVVAFPKKSAGDEPDNGPDHHPDPEYAPTPEIVEPELPRDMIENAAMAPAGESQLRAVAEARFRRANTRVVAFGAQEDVLTAKADSVRALMAGLDRRRQRTKESEIRYTEHHHPNGEPKAMYWFRRVAWLIALAVMGVAVWINAGFFLRSGVFPFVELLWVAALYALLPLFLGFALEEALRHLVTEEARRRVVLVVAIIAAALVPVWIVAVSYLYGIAALADALMGRELPQHLVAGQYWANFVVVVTAMLCEALIAFLMKARATHDTLSLHVREAVRNAAYDDLTQRFDQHVRDLAQIDAAIAARREVKEQFEPSLRAYVEAQVLLLASVKDEQRAIAITAMQAARRPASAAA